MYHQLVLLFCCIIVSPIHPPFVRTGRGSILIHTPITTAYTSTLYDQSMPSADRLESSGSQHEERDREGRGYDKGRKSAKCT